MHERIFKENELRFSDYPDFSSIVYIFYLPFSAFNTAIKKLQGICLAVFFFYELSVS
jgi:hypothetical protein